MDMPLNILVVEDSEQDFMLLCRSLRKNGITFNNVRRVDNDVQMNEALSDLLWDVVITDVNLPGFSAGEALKVYKKHGCDKPFIVISGVISEAQGISLLKAGAHDFLSKNDYSRLVPAIERELKEADERQKRRQAEISLKKSEQRFRMLFENTPVATLECDFSEVKRFIDVLKEKYHGNFDAAIAQEPDIIRQCVKLIQFFDLNQAALTLFHASHKDELTDYLKICFSLDCYSIFKEMIYVIWNNQVNYKIESVIKTLAGKIRNVSIHWLTIPNVEEDLSMTLFSIIDITDLKLIVQELESLKNNLERQVSEEIEKRQKQQQILIQQSKLAAMGEMIGAIAHQWRQPLNTVALMIQELKSSYHYGELDDDTVELIVGESMKQVLHMSKTIDDFRNFFKPAQEKSSFNVIESVNEALSMVFYPLTQLSISIKTDFNMQDKLEIQGYQNEFKQVLINIIMNAKDAIERRRAKEENLSGEIQLTIVQTYCYIILTIQDNGGGIDESIIHRIFEPYFTTDKVSGTGIGLYMSKAIIEDSMNGKIEAANVNDGARFTIRLQAV
jgi:signal transduction histidine kinase/CheY-like chemotaxis protein